MLKRILKPENTHLMAPNEEYCRLIYERQWNAPTIFNLNVEIFDKGGVRVRKTYERITAAQEKQIIQDVLGEGWETIFMQNYEDWLVRCQKRPRSPSGVFKYLPAVSDRQSSPWRQLILGALALGVAILAFGWVSGRIPPYSPTWNNSSVPNNSGDDTNLDGASSSEEGLESLGTDANPESESAEGEMESDRNSRPSSNNPVEDNNAGNEANNEALSAEPELGSSESPDSSESNNNNETATATDRTILEDEASDPDTSAPSITEQDREPESTDTQISRISRNRDEESFLQAVRVAQAAVIGGETAETSEEWEALAERWQEAADLMAAVSSNSTRYEVAQDRIEIYEANREIALDEAEKAAAN